MLKTKEKYFTLLLLPLVVLLFELSSFQFRYDSIEIVMGGDNGLKMQAHNNDEHKQCLLENPPKEQ